MKDISDTQVCEAIRDKGEQFATHLLMEQTGQCEKVCELVIERAISRGLVDCGVSARTGWLTEKGKKLLESH